MSQLLGYGLTLVLGFVLGNVFKNINLIKNQTLKNNKLPLLDIVRFMEISKYQSGIDKPIITGDDLKKWIPKPPIGWPPPCNPYICVDRDYFDNIIISDEGDFTLKISDNGKLIVNEEIKEFKEDTKHRIFSLKTNVPLNQKVSLELSVVYKDGSSKEIILDEVIFIK